MVGNEATEAGELSAKPDAVDAEQCDGQRVLLDGGAGADDYGYGWALNAVIMLAGSLRG